MRVRWLPMVAAVAAAGCGTPEGKAPPGDTFAAGVKADWLSQKTLYLGEIHGGEARDFPYENPPLYRAFSFQAPAGGVRFDARVSGGDPVAWLVDEQDVIIAENDDVDPSTQDARIVVPALAEGRYFVVVRDYAMHDAQMRLTVNARQAFDAGVADAATSDASAADGGVRDAGTHDAPADAGTPDALPDAAVDPVVTGAYRLESSIDVGGAPGAGAALAVALSDMVDGPSDPATWLLDAMVEGTGSNPIAGLRPAADVALEAFFAENVAVDLDGHQVKLPAKLHEIVDDSSLATRRIVFRSRLEITRVGNAYTARHVVDGVTFVVEGRRLDRQLWQLGVADIVVASVPLTVHGGTLTIGDHAIGFPSKIFAAGVGDVVLPLLGPDATTFRELLADHIDCSGAGEVLATDLGFGTASLWESLCDTSVVFGGDRLDGLLGAFAQQASFFHLHGSVSLVDSNHDGVIDTLAGGLWQGSFSAGGASTPLPANQIFTGQRQ